MTINTKEFQKALKKLLDYFTKEEMRFVLCASTTKGEHIKSGHLSNQHYVDTIIMLQDALLFLVKENYTDETASNFKLWLEKSIDELISIYRQKEDLKKESKLAKIISFGVRS